MAGQFSRQLDDVSGVVAAAAGRNGTGAVLSTAAVGLLHLGAPHAERSRVGQTLALAGMSALSFSLCDVLLQKWVHLWGSGRCLPPMFLFNTLYTFAFMPFFRGRLRDLNRQAWLWTGGGGRVAGGQ